VPSDRPEKEDTMASIRATLATAGTLAALGGLTAFAVGAGDARPAAEPAAAPAEEVRTQVVTRTINRREPATRTGSSQGSGGSVPAVATPSSGGGSDQRGRGPGAVDRSADDADRGGRGRSGDDDDGFDDHGGNGRGGDDDVFDDHSGHGRGGDDDVFDDHGGGDDHSGHGGGGDD
jgi:hypothetical protein